MCPRVGVDEALLDPRTPDGTKRCHFQWGERGVNLRLLFVLEIECDQCVARR